MMHAIEILGTKVAPIVRKALGEKAPQAENAPVRTSSANVKAK
jgi:hypothetical protein